MTLSDFSWNARWQIPASLWRSNTLLYVLIGAFALAGAILLGLNVARSYQQTLELHSRQLDVGTMVTEDYLSQTLEQTRLLLLDRASQWKQLPELARTTP